MKYIVLICLMGITFSLRAQYLFEEIDSIFTKADSKQAENVHMPSIIVTQKGTVIAATQLRKESKLDWGHDSEILLRRSTDACKTWEPAQKVYSQKGINAVNGPIVEDRVTGQIIYPMTLPSVKETTQAWVEYHERSGGNLQYITSDDDGKTCPVAQNLDPSYAGYSYLAVTEYGNILCIYGADTFIKDANARIKLIRLSRDAVENVYTSRKKNLT